MKLGGEATRETKGSSEKNLESFSCNELCLGLEADCDALEADTRNAQDSRTGGQSQMIINANPSSEMKDPSSSGPGRMKEKGDGREGKRLKNNNNQCSCQIRAFEQMAFGVQFGLVLDN